MGRSGYVHTILLVDDEEGIRNVLNITLGHAGFNVLLAPDGDQGLAIFESHRPDIVISDIKMPGIDGIEVLKKVKASRPNIEVIILTGHGSVASAAAWASGNLASEQPAVPKTGRL